MVKDKFIFGLLHLCLSPEEARKFGWWWQAKRDGRIPEWADAINQDRADRSGR